MTNLYEIHIQDNAGLTCYPECLSSVPIQYLGTLTQYCPSYTDHAICNVIASTNVATLDPSWECRVNGTMLTDPCKDNWSYVNCSNGYIDHLYFKNSGLTGTATKALL